MFRTLFFLIIISIFSFSSRASETENKLVDLVDKLCDGMAVHDKPTLAVLPFENTSTVHSRAGQGIAEFLVVLFQAKDQFTLVDRIHFQKTLAELSLSQSGLISEGRALSAGKSLEARFLVTGTITDALGKTVVAARILETETGEIVATASIPVDRSMLMNFTTEILGEKGTVSSTMFRSVVVPGWGQFYAEEKIRGTVSLGLFLLGSGFCVYSGVSLAKAASHYNDFRSMRDYQSGISRLRAEFQVTGGDPLDQAAFNAYLDRRQSNLKDQYDSRFRLLMIGSCITGGIWISNIIDAAVAGVQSKKKLDLYFGMHHGNLQTAARISF